MKKCFALEVGRYKNTVKFSALWFKKTYNKIPIKVYFYFQ